ncbi:hypothetical protein VTO42DRAFT_8168 [Malbranchea cinnamomea]
MDAFLAKVTQQAMTYAIRSGISITASYAIRQSSRLLKKVDGADREELQMLQERLQSKIRIISPAIDMIELIAARGNTSLESAVSLTKAIRWDIQNLGQRLSRIASDDAFTSRSSRNRARIDAEIKAVNREIQALLDRIEDAVPLINLAITTSGVNLSTSLPQSVSPSRLLQASTFLTAGDTQYSISPSQAVQVGPTFTLSVYLLFAGHVRPQDEEGIRNTTWKEAIHKARVILQRVPMDVVLQGPGEESISHNHFREAARADEFAYRLLIIEDLDDGRVHEEDDTVKPSSFEGVAMAGIRESIPIHQVSKIFYADTGKILNIGSEGENNNPVLLLKRDVNAIPPRRMMVRAETENYYSGNNSEEERDEEKTTSKTEEDDVQAQLEAQLLRSADEWPVETGPAPGVWGFPPGLDLEWIAFEVYQEPEDSDSETEAETEETEGEQLSTPHSPSADLHERMTRLRLNGRQGSPASLTDSKHLDTPSQSLERQQDRQSLMANPTFSNIRTSLSLLETLLRLTSLQQFQQQSHLSITDELLNFFLEESSTTGAGGDEHHRRRIRAEARRKVGWDPYDESPLKRRGEEYQYQVREEEQEDWGRETPGSRWADETGSRSSPSPASLRVRQRDRRSSYARETPNPHSPASSPSMRRQGRSDVKLRRQIPGNRSLRQEEVRQSIERHDEVRLGE